MTIKFIKIVYETEKASLVEFEDYKKKWLPHSNIIFKGNNEVEIKEWLYKKLKRKKVKKSWEQFMKDNNLVYSEHCEVW